MARLSMNRLPWCSRCSRPLDLSPLPMAERLPPSPNHSPRPDPDVVDHLVAVAGQKARQRLAESSSAERADRAPRRSSRSRHTASRRLLHTGLVLAVGLLVGLGWWHVDVPADLPADVPGHETPSAPVVTAPSPSAAPSSLPAWDDRDDMVRLHRHIELVQARSTNAAWTPVSAGR